jgi:Holliday junction resolvasome RuvABC ATP-dependent DNA helicase subunit
VADEALNILAVDRFGLDEMDRRILLTLIDKFQGGPIGIDTLATVVCEEKNTLEDVYEPFLIQSGFLVRTPGAGWRRWRRMSTSGGRCITASCETARSFRRR